MKVFSAKEDLGLARKLARVMKAEVGKVDLSEFANQELRVWVKDNKPGKEVIVLASLAVPGERKLIEMLLLVDALKRMGVKEIMGVIPYMGYSKQDKVFRKGEPLSMEVIAGVLDTAGFKKIITFDLHNPESVKGFKTPVVNLSARDLLAEKFREEVDRGKGDKGTVVLAPDKGGVELAEEMGKKLGVKVVYVRKERDLETGKVKILGLKGEVRNRKVLVFDDMLATGSTLIEIANFLRKQGVQLIKVGLTHHLYIPGVQEKIDKSVIDKLVVTDTVRQKDKSRKLEVVSIVDLLASKIEIDKEK